MGIRRKISFKKGQSSIEVAIVLGVLAIVVVAMMRSWVWVSGNMVNRLEDYKNTRKEAGKQDSPGKWSSTPKTELTIFK